MKYFSSAILAIVFVFFVLFSEFFMDSINTKIMFWDNFEHFLNRQEFMTMLGYGMILILIVFTVYTMIVMCLLAINLSNNGFLTKERLDSIAAGHLLLIYAILLACLVGNPVYQLISNIYVLHGFANFLIWYLIPFAAGLVWSAFVAFRAALKCFIRAFN